MKTGQKVKFIGASKEQVSWGGNDDPNPRLKVGDVVTISDVDVHSWHTKLQFKEIPGSYNSVSFEVVRKNVRTSFEYLQSND